MKRKTVVLLAVMIGLTFSVNSAFAEHHWRKSSEWGGKTCALKGQSGSSCGKSCKGECYKEKKEKSLEDKLMMKFKAIWDHQEALGVSEEQLAQIKAIKVDLKKELIQKKADVEIVKVDFYALLYEDELDLEAINQLIDKKYEAKKAKTKKIVSTYAELKKILSKEQMDHLKELNSGKKSSSLPVAMQKLIPPADK